MALEEPLTTLPHELLDAIGTEASVGVAVEPAMTAAALRSGDVDVLATPALLALVERAAVAVVSGRLSEGTTTVGTMVELEHLAATPVGTRVRARARLQSVEGPRLTFSFDVADRGGTVAQGIHVRALIDRTRFQSGAVNRVAPQGRVERERAGRDAR